MTMILCDTLGARTPVAHSVASLIYCKWRESENARKRPFMARCLVAARLPRV